jgi:acetyl-CoA acetyltransferase
MDANGFRDRAAVVGIGATEFSKQSGRSELQLAAEATLDALADAGLSPADVDGMVTYTGDASEEIAIARSIGIPELTFFSRIPHGGGAACATVQQAAMAVATGVAEVVVCYRALNERSGGRFGRATRSARGLEYSMSHPYGLVTPAAWVTMSATRYMHDYGATNQDFGRVSVAARRHAATNPKAWFYERPISLADHQSSRWIVEPALRLLDCCQESDGAVAVVVTTAARAAGLRRPPVAVVAAAQGSAWEQQSMESYYRDEIDRLPEMELVGRQLWTQSRLSADDIQTAVIYDHFTPFVLLQLEALGFCGRGEGKDFVKDGTIELGGRLPLNPHGGQLGEAYIHGMNGIAEAVRQVRGTSVNQVPSVEHVLVTAGTGVPTSGLILGRGNGVGHGPAARMREERSDG